MAPTQRGSEPGTLSIRIKVMQPPGAQSASPCTLCLEAINLGADEQFVSANNFKAGLSRRAALRFFVYDCFALSQALLTVSFRVKT